VHKFLTCSFNLNIRNNSDLHIFPSDNDDVRTGIASHPTSNGSSINDAEQSDMSGCEDVDDELGEVFSDDEAEEDVDDERDDEAAEEIDDERHSDNELHDKFDTEGLAHACVVSAGKEVGEEGERELPAACDASLETRDAPVVTVSQIANDSVSFLL
jgi:hypothetical protein